MAFLAGGPRSWLRGCTRFAVASRLPLGVWAATTAIVLAAAAYARHNPFASGIWVHSDSKLYLAQVERGVHLYRCPAAPATEWCGNSGWFPGYPWLIDALHAAGAPPAGTGVALSWLFGAATLVLLWWTFLRRQRTYSGIVALVYAAVAPGIAFRYGVYPLSMLGFFTVACLWLLARERIVLAGLAGAAAMCSYPVALALVPASAVWLLAPRAGLALARRFRDVVVACGLIVCGLALVLGTQWIEVGRPDAYFLVQDKYDHTLREPFAPIHNALRALHRTSELALRDVPHVETLVLSFTLGAVLVALLARRGRNPGEDGLIAVWAVTAWLLTSVPADLSHYREDAVLLPLAPLLRRLPRPLSAAIVLAVACLVVPMTILYVRGRLP